MAKSKGDIETRAEVILKGIAASPGIVVGPCYLCSHLNWQPEPQVVDPANIPTQIERFRESVERTHRELQKTYRTTREQFGQELAEVLEMQVALLEDQFFLKEVEDMIAANKVDAAYATFVVFRKKKEYFLKMSNDYFRDRAFDIQALKEMIIRNIAGSAQSCLEDFTPGSIIIADNLSPNDTVALHQKKVLGVATNAGGKMSHTAIVARSLGVPAVLGLKNITERVQTGDVIILDGNSGKVILNPSDRTREQYETQQEKFLEIQQILLEECAQETYSKDGRRIFLHANIEFEEEMPHLLSVKPDGIGLFRTEGLFLNQQEMPSEDQQAEIYSRVAEQMHPKPVVIRTLDIGGDKIVPGIATISEDNPFLGWRAIRFWLDHQAGFVMQLKAILRANIHGNVQILLPMVSSLGEVLQSKQLLEEAKRLLKKEGKPFGEEIDLGIMIEIPSVVILADILAREVDFFSIGTNDLVQYTLAVDRGNEKVAKLYSHFHPAILRMVKTTLDAGKYAGIPVNMCGEMAGDPQAIPLLLAMGFEHLSASHMTVPHIKRIIRELSLPECEELYQAVKSLELTEDIISCVEQFYRERFTSMLGETQ